MMLIAKDQLRRLLGECLEQAQCMGKDTNGLAERLALLPDSYDAEVLFDNNDLITDLFSQRYIAKREKPDGYPADTFEKKISVEYPRANRSMIEFIVALFLSSSVE